mmetsp:Transcript_8884/g.25381  ORF Transcript_8884/g.25381 Transcript_8884/m.25381 type:complete len:315 (-) Transcript_8884:259-1203(-)
MAEAARLDTEAASQNGRSVHSVQDSLRNLSRFGVSLSGQPPKPTAEDKRKLLEARRRAETCEDQYGRYVPAVASAVDQFCRRHLSTERYPYVIEPPTSLYQDEGSADAGPSAAGGSKGLGFSFPFGSAFSSKSKATARPPTPPSSSNGMSGIARSVRRKPSNVELPREEPDTSAFREVTARRRPQGGRVLVFIAGGATPAELSAIQNLMNVHSRDIIVGCTHIVTPKRFVHDLSFVDPNKVEMYYEARAAFEQMRRDAARQQLEEEVEAEARAAPRTIESAKIRAHKGAKKRLGRSFLGCGCMNGPPPHPNTEA